MRFRVAAPGLALVLFACTASAQPIPPDWQRAASLYLTGWSELSSDPIAAEKTFSQAISVYDEFALGHYGLGRSYMAQKRYSEALIAYERAESLFRALGSDRVNAQLGLLRRNYRDASAQEQNRLSALNRKMTPSGASRTRTATEIELENQMNVMEQATQKDTRSTVTGAVPSFLSLAMGSAYFRLNRLPDAEQAYSRAIEANPRSGEAHLNLAVVYLVTKRFRDAEREIKAAERAGQPVPRGLKDDVKKGLKARDSGR